MDIQELESVQRTFTSKISECYGLDYWERLKKLDLMSQRKIHHSSHVEAPTWSASNEADVQFYKRSRFGTLANVPSIPRHCRGSTSGHQSLYENSFAGPKIINILIFFGIAFSVCIEGRCLLDQAEGFTRL